MNSEYRKLSQAEIKLLEANGCRSDSWEKVSVVIDLDLNRLNGCEFQGNVSIGRLDEYYEAFDGIRRRALLLNSRFNNVTIGNNCHIANVNGWLSNLDIGDQVIIENVGSIICDGESTFGNGQVIELLNEGGGRELKITIRTSAQTAYLNTLYRHRTKLINRLDAIADDFTEKRKSNRAAISNHVRILNCGTLRNVQVGTGAHLEGVGTLENGTIDSALEAPTFIGSGVTADNFIIQKGATVTDSAMVSACLIGEGTRIGKQFSAENSALFANCEGFHSEVCSILAGPYTVTHHRSTLLIAGLFSFLNAGSATNQSNHMYKLGPVHQGILERGCKTGSGSYLLWPARVGAFSAVMGKHYANFDTADFPFSYLDIINGKSYLIPGMNFLTVGTLRDGLKWPNRDQRKNADKLDMIIFDVLSPYTAQKMLRAQQTMQELYAKTVKGQESVLHNGIHIKRLLLKTCGRYYQMALDMYFGDLLIRRIEALGQKATPAAIGSPDPDGEAGNGEWVDVNGLLCCQSRLERLIVKIETGQINDFDRLQAAFQVLYSAYRSDEWNWYLAIFEELQGKKLSEATNEDLEGMLDIWQKATRKYLNLVANDAKKEFEGNVRIGYGIDSKKDDDFTAVRGTYTNNKFVKQLDDMATEFERRYHSALNSINQQQK